MADVSGKSITGAFMMGITRAIMRAVAPRELSPKATLIRLNEALCANMRKGMFVTMLYIVIDLENLRVRISSAGHDPLFYKKGGCSGYELINPDGCAMGVSRGTFGDRLGEAELKLNPCDIIALTTDGINEATSADGEIFGENRMYSLLCGTVECAEPELILGELTNSLDAHYKGSEPSDDATIVILKIKEANQYA
jgi:serine phosphatase RsbU (regulator of sigma subunit)